MKEIVQLFVDRLLPGSQINESLAASTVILYVRGDEFRRLNENGKGDPNNLIMALRVHTGEIYIPINQDAIGAKDGQVPQADVPYGVLHELVETGVVEPPEYVKRAAMNVSQRTTIPGIETIFRFHDIPHLTALGAEYAAALQSKGTLRDGKIELARYHRSTTRARRERREGTFLMDPNQPARIAMLREILK